MRAASGLSLGIAAAALFGSSGSFASSLMATGWSPAAAALVRMTGAALLLTIPAVKALRGQWALLRRDLPMIVLFGVLAVGGGQLFYFNAVEHLSVSVALLMEYSGVVLVVLWAWLANGRRPNRVTASGAFLALIGLLLVLNIAGGAHADAIGVVWGLGAALGLACYYLAAEDKDETVPPIVVAWGGLAVGALGLATLGSAGVVPMRISTSSVSIGGHHMSWLVPILGLVIAAGALAYTVGIAATRRLGATMSSFLGLAEVLFAAGFAWALVGQRPTSVQAVGGLVVLAGIVLVRAGEIDRTRRRDAEDFGFESWAELELL